MLFATRVRAFERDFFIISLFFFFQILSHFYGTNTLPADDLFSRCQKGPERENFGLVHTWAYTECRNSKLEAETGAFLACKKCLFHRYI